MKPSLTLADRYNMVSVPCDDELHSHLQRSHARTTLQRQREGLKPLKFAAHLRNLWRLALNLSTAVPVSIETKSPRKPNHRKIE
jgi:hypothetical protein